MSSGNSLCRRSTSAGPYWFRKDTKPIVRSCGWPRGRRARGSAELPAQRLVAPLRRLDHLAVERLQVVLHPSECRFRGALERRVDGRDGLDQRRHLRFDGSRGGGERLLDRRRDLRLEQRVERRLVLRLQRFERQLVFGEEPEGGRVEQRGAGARIDQRHRHAEVLVDAAQLAEIRELVRSGDITGGREQCVLNHRPQQHARAESGRTDARFLLRAPRLERVSPRTAAVLLTDRAAAPSSRNRATLSSWFLTCA